MRSYEVEKVETREKLRPSGVPHERAQVTIPSCRVLNTDRCLLLSAVPIVRRLAHGNT